jgi:hypothetical protein
MAGVPGRLLIPLRRTSPEWDSYRGTPLEALKLLRMLLNRAVGAEAIGRNPAPRIPAPEAKRSRVRVLTPQELANIVEQLPERWRAV